MISTSIIYSSPDIICPRPIRSSIYNDCAKFIREISDKIESTEAKYTNDIISQKSHMDVLDQSQTSDMYYHS